MQTYAGILETSKIKSFAKIVNQKVSLIFVAKPSIFDVYRNPVGPKSKNRKWSMLQSISSTEDRNTCGTCVQWKKLTHTWI